MAEKDSVSHRGDALEVNQQFLRHNDTSGLGINTEKPKFPQYAVASKRLESYKSWPSYMPIQPELMVDAGLVFTGVGDSVRCYYCGGGLRNWEAGDDPWEEHAKWYPKCSHVILVKGQKYIDCVGRGEKPEPDGPLLKVKKPAETVSNDQLMQTVAALSCQEFGYSESAILKAIKLYQKNNNGGIDFKAADILTIILEQEETDSSEAAGGQDPEPSLYDCCNNKECSCEEEDPEEVNKLYEENQRLKENQMCKICLDDVANVIFLPCGHMVSCPRCAPALTKCPLCRLVVSGTVKAFFE